MGTISPKQGSKVIIQEINLSQVIVSASSSVASEIIVAAQGRTVPVQFTNGTDFMTEYGNPDASISYDIYSGNAYFTEGNDLWGLRVVGAGATYGAILMYQNGLDTGLYPIPTGVADPTNPDWNALLPTALPNAIPIALWYPLKGQGSYSDTLGMSITSTNIVSPAFTAANLGSSPTGGALPAATYSYQISALFQSAGANQETLVSNSAEIVIASSTSTNSVTLTWALVSGAIGYNIYGRTAGGTYGLVATVGGGTTTFTDGIPNPTTGLPIAPDTTKQPITDASSVTVNQTFVVDIFDTSVNSSVAKEQFNCTLFDNTDSSGMETEMEQSVNPFSSLVQVTSNVPNLSPTQVPTAITSVGLNNFAGGDSGSAVTSFDVAGAWAQFDNKQLYAINIQINSGHSTPDVQLAMDTLAQGRGDTVALLDVPSASQQFQQAIDYRNLQLNLNSTYSALFAPDVLIADTINGKQQYIPFSGYAAALCARTDRVANPSFSIAGLNRGLLDVLKTRQIYDQGEMDVLFNAQVNYTQTFIGQGIALWEQQTLAAEFSALSWLSVRRIVNVMKTALYNFLLYSLQEPNDDFTGRQIVSSCSDYLTSLQNARAISGFTVVSDETNNSAQDFNSGIRNVTVIIIPVIPIHIINLQVVVSKQGVTFAEVLAQVQPG